MSLFSDSTEPDIDLLDRRTRRTLDAPRRPVGSGQVKHKVVGEQAFQIINLALGLTV